jgi:hypothetical protein
MLYHSIGKREAAMVNNYDKHVELMTKNLAEFGLTLNNVFEKTKKMIYIDEHPHAYAGKMFEDNWED